MSWERMLTVPAHQTLYQHFSLALSLRLCNVSNSMHLVLSQVAVMLGDMYQNKLFRNVKPRRGRQRVSLSKIIDDPFVFLGKSC